MYREYFLCNLINYQFKKEKQGLNKSAGLICLPVFISAMFSNNAFDDFLMSGVQMMITVKSNPFNFRCVITLKAEKTIHQTSRIVSANYLLLISNLLLIHLSRHAY